MSKVKTERRLWLLGLLGLLGLAQAADASIAIDSFNSAGVALAPSAAVDRQAQPLSSSGPAAALRRFALGQHRAEPAAVSPEAPASQTEATSQSVPTAE
jgi:hypothetical protein